MNEQTMHRSELHLHTVMSEDTSVIMVGDAVQAAVAMGYKALAITNRNSVQSFYAADYYRRVLGEDLKLIFGVEIDNDRTFTALAKDQVGLKALYKLISGKPITDLERTHLLIGYCYPGFACSQLSEQHLREHIGAYDYVELPVTDDPYCQKVNQKRYAFCKELGIPAVAVGNCHNIIPQDVICKTIVDYVKDDAQPLVENTYMRTTEEMLDAFSCLGEEAAYEVVVTNPNMLADQVEQLHIYEIQTPIFSLPDAAERVRGICTEKMQLLYGDKPPKEITDRLDAEFSLLRYFASLYLLTQDLTRHIHSLGGMTGCRGYMGSTLMAYLLDISNINPLPAHYRCPNCLHTQFVNVENGRNLPRKTCPHCGNTMIGDGHDIPYETGMGLDGDKQPILDINIPQNMQDQAVSYLTGRFGKERLAYAGTIQTLMDRLAESYVQVYCHKADEELEDTKRIVQRLSKVKKRDGIQPFGIVLLPEGMEWEDVTPLRTLDKPIRGIDKAIHMEYYELEYILPKISILGNDVMDRLQKLLDVTAVKLEDIDLHDPAIYRLIGNLDTCGIPEYASDFCKGILCKLNNLNFSDLLRVIGMSHGTNTWNENGEHLIEEGHKFRELISTRDDIFHTLQTYGVDRRTAFTAMETVRKGKFSMDTPQNAKIIEKLENSRVPQWYIQSMKTIRYLFPKAHAAYHTEMAVALAWFKVYYPEQFYNVTLQDLGAEAYMNYDDIDLEWMLEEISRTDRTVARQREAMELLIEARTRKIPIHF